MGRKGAFSAVVFLGAFLVLILGFVSAFAQETEWGAGEFAFEEGLSAFEEGNWPVALRKFTEAAKAEPNNAQAHHYRGVTLLKLNQPEAAIQALSKARDLNPEMEDVNLDLGQAYQELGKLDEAEQAYREEIKGHPDNADAHFSLGYLLFTKGRYEECIAKFAKARELDPKLGAAARFYEGAALFKTGKAAEAKTAFNQVLGMNPSPEITAAAKKYLEAIKTKAPKKNWGLVGSMIYQWDSNVVAASHDAIFPLTIGEDQVSGQEDWRTVLTLSGYYRFTPVKPWIVEARYSFYQSFHNELHIFNLQNHSPAITISRTQKLLGRDFMVALDYSFGEALMDTDLSWYSVNHWITSSFTIKWSKSLTETLGYRFNIEDFREMNPNRDNTSNTVFDRLSWVFWNRRASLSHMVGMDFEESEDQAYDVQRFWTRLALGAMLPLKVKTKLSLGYEYENHQNDDVLEREDHAYSIEFLLFRSIWGPLEANVGVVYKENQSNVDSFSYDRTIVGGGLIVRY